MVVYRDNDRRNAEFTCTNRTALIPSHVVARERRSGDLSLELIGTLQ